MKQDNFVSREYFLKEQTESIFFTCPDNANG